MMMTPKVMQQTIHISMAVAILIDSYINHGYINVNKPSTSTKTKQLPG